MLVQLWPSTIFLLACISFAFAKLVLDRVTLVGRHRSVLFDSGFPLKWSSFSASVGPALLRFRGHLYLSLYPELQLRCAIQPKIMSFQQFNRYQHALCLPKPDTGTIQLRVSKGKHSPCLPLTAVREIALPNWVLKRFQELFKLILLDVLKELHFLCHFGIIHFLFLAQNNEVDPALQVIMHCILDCDQFLSVILVVCHNPWQSQEHFFFFRLHFLACCGCCSPIAFGFCAYLYFQDFWCCADLDFHSFWLEFHDIFWFDCCHSVAQRCLAQRFDSSFFNAIRTKFLLASWNALLFKFGASSLLSQGFEVLFQPIRLP